MEELERVFKIVLLALSGGILLAVVAPEILEDESLDDFLGIKKISARNPRG